jgi:hypothetical protein
MDDSTYVDWAEPVGVVLALIPENRQTAIGSFRSQIPSPSRGKMVAQLEVAGF